MARRQEATRSIQVHLGMRRAMAAGPSGRRNVSHRRTGRLFQSVPEELQGVGARLDRGAATDELTAITPIQHHASVNPPEVALRDPHRDLLGNNPPDTQRSAPSQVEDIPQENEEAPVAVEAMTALPYDYDDDGDDPIK